MPVGVHCPSHLLMTNDELLCRCCTCSMLHHSTVSSIHFSLRSSSPVCSCHNSKQNWLLQSTSRIRYMCPKYSFPPIRVWKTSAFIQCHFFTSISVIFLALSYKPLCILITTNNVQFLSYKFHDIFALSLNWTSVNLFINHLTHYHSFLKYKLAAHNSPTVFTVW